MIIVVAHLVEAARRREAACAAGWAAGQTMTLERAIAVAL
jgi:hypothetical protein